jgi:ribosome maturation factor RimP
MDTAERHAIVERVRGAAHPILSSMGLELIDVEPLGGNGRILLRVFIDKPGGVTLEDCAQASIHIGHALDVADPVPGPYTLEVSSPGLDRPLKKIEDYRRSKGKLIRVKFAQSQDGQWVMTGRLMESDPEGIELEMAGGDRRRVRFEEIKQARLELEW